MTQSIMPLHVAVNAFVTWQDQRTQQQHTAENQNHWLHESGTAPLDAITDQ